MSPAWTAAVQIEESSVYMSVPHTGLRHAARGALEIDEHPRPAAVVERIRPPATATPVGSPDTPCPDETARGAAERVASASSDAEGAASPTDPAAKFRIALTRTRATAMPKIARRARSVAELVDRRPGAVSTDGLGWSRMARLYRWRQGPRRASPRFVLRWGLPPGFQGRFGLRPGPSPLNPDSCMP